MSLVWSACAAGAQAQTTTITSVEAKPLGFEVVSVGQNTAPGGPAHVPDMGPTPDGYRAINSPLLFPLITAYVPSEGNGALYSFGQISGLPDWAMQERYDIVAKVAESELPEWQKPASQSGMLRAMLQTFFVERCKLAVHRETKEDSVYLLLAAKGGPKLKETNPAETHTGVNIPSGGVIMPGERGMMTYGITTGTLAMLLTQMSGGTRTVVDKTGLTGRYDMVLMMRERSGPEMDMETMVQRQLDELGLKLQAGKAPVERLVIDHMERPSAN